MGKFSEYPEAFNINGTDMFLIDQNGITKKAYADVLKKYNRHLYKGGENIAEWIYEGDLKNILYINNDEDGEEYISIAYIDGIVESEIIPLPSSNAIFFRDNSIYPSFTLITRSIDNFTTGIQITASTYRNALYSVPISGHSISLGITEYKWKELYAENGTIQTSDRNEKNSFEDLLMSIVGPFILGLKPMKYKMNSGTSDRFHWGLISQDIEELLEELNISDLDFAGFIKSPKIRVITEDENGDPLKEPIEEIIEGEYTYSLRYDEFISPIIKFIQNLYHRYEEHEERISTLEAENAALKDKIDESETRIADLETKLNQVLAKLD